MESVDTKYLDSGGRQESMPVDRILCNLEVSTPAGLHASVIIALQTSINEIFNIPVGQNDTSRHDGRGRGAVTDLCWGPRIESLRDDLWNVKY